MRNNRRLLTILVLCFPLAAVALLWRVVAVSERRDEVGSVFEVDGMGDGLLMRSFSLDEDVSATIMVVLENRDGPASWVKATIATLDRATGRGIGDVKNLAPHVLLMCGVYDGGNQTRQFGASSSGTLLIPRGGSFTLTGTVYGGELTMSSESPRPKGNVRLFIQPITTDERLSSIRSWKDFAKSSGF